MKQSEQIGKLALALSKAQAQLDGAAKTSANPFFKSKYADLHECIEAAKPALSANELAVVQTTDTGDGGIWVYTTLLHSSGEWVQGRILMKPKKDDDQSTGSSITYGRRYGFAAIVGLAQKDDDGNGATGVEKKKEEKKPQEPKPADKATEDREDVEKWLAWVDKFTTSGATVDQFIAEWDKYKESAQKKLPAHQFKELLGAKGEMETYLMEQVKA
jgi:hypothetical protein